MTIYNCLETFKNDNKIYNTRLSEIKPLYRGWIHLKVTYYLLFIIINLICYLLYENIIYYKYNYSIRNFNNHIVNNDIVNINKFKAIIYFLLLKLCSYSSSSLLHKYPFKNKKLMEMALRLDLIAISISVYGTCFIFIYNLQEFKNYQNYNLYFILITVLCVFKDNKSILSKLDKLRMFFMMCHSNYVFYIVGKLVYYNILWKLSYISYIVSFSIYGLKQIKYKPMYWHKPLIYGYHEDFHLILLLADFISFILGIKYLYNI
jgi:hypothetical protein